MNLFEVMAPKLFEAAEKKTGADNVTCIEMIFSRPGDLISINAISSAGDYPYFTDIKETFVSSSLSEAKSSPYGDIMEIVEKKIKSTLRGVQSVDIVISRIKRELNEKNRHEYTQTTDIAYTTTAGQKVKQPFNL
jgi:hypothetical protein